MEMSFLLYLQGAKRIRIGPFRPKDAPAMHRAEARLFSQYGSPGPGDRVILITVDDTLRPDGLVDIVAEDLDSNRLVQMNPPKAPKTKEGRRDFSPGR